jgi:hypothetical protein
VKKALFTLVILGVFATAASAAQPVSHAASGTISDPVGDLRLGSTITFNTTNDNLKGWQYPMVVVACYQDLDGDGLVTLPAQYEGAPDLAYATLDYPASTFLLGGGWSPWLENGGPATCVAKLYAYGSKAGAEQITLLAQTATFEAAG